MRADWCGPEVYAAAGDWFAHCLQRDGSLFTPDRAIWTLELGEALDGHIGSPDIGSGTFVEKLVAQLEGLEPDAIQLAAELLFLELLGETDTNGDLKLEHVGKVLALLPQPVVVPDHLKAALSAGGVARYGPAKAFRDAYLRFLNKLLIAWKEMDGETQARIAADPWEVLPVVEAVRTSTDAMAANALLHLLFPETFEYMISPGHREKLMKAFADAPGVASIEGDNRKLAAIRTVGTQALGRDLQPYEAPVVQIWREPTLPQWTQAVDWAADLFGRDDFAREEREYKLELAAKVGSARDALLAGEQWRSALRQALADKDNNLLGWRARDKFVDWCDRETVGAEAALQSLWSAEEPADALTQFLEGLPKEAVSGQGTRLSIATYLLLAVDPTGVPFYKPTVHQDFARIVGLESPVGVEIDPDSTYRPERLAELLGVSGKQVRRFLREAYPRDAEEQGQSWILPADQAVSVVARFAQQADPTSTIAPFAEWVSLLEELRLRLLGGGVVVRDLLDVQGLAYWIAQGAPPADWPKSKQEAFEQFRQAAGSEGETTEGPKKSGPTDKARRERTRREGKCQLCEVEVPLEEQFTLENDRDNLRVIKTQDATRDGAEALSHYCADCASRREKEKQRWLDQQEGRPGDEDEDVVPVPLGPPVGASPALAARLYLPQVWLQGIIDLLWEKKQAIFYGPPGTGKTFVARALAAHLTAGSGAVRLVQFHPSYTYEDFFEGYRPLRGEDGQIGFELVPGVLREIAEEARDRPQEPAILVIDEINRGNIAKIFGELYYLLEYRDEAVQLQYSRAQQFSIPSNLLVIGTMNTADRSIALVDSALRRRFNFVEFDPRRPPIDKLLALWLAGNGLDPEPAALLDSLNEAISDHDFAVGPSYLMTRDGSEPSLDSIWEHAVMPLLEERFYGSQRDIAGEFGLEALRRRTAQEADLPTGQETVSLADDFS